MAVQARVSHNHYTPDFPIISSVVAVVVVVVTITNIEHKLLSLSNSQPPQRK